MPPPSYPILFVDDEVDLIDTFRSNFERDFEVLSATSGPAALDILASHPVAVMVTDQRMPGMYGLEVISKAREIRPDLQPIILTGYTNDRDLIDAINLRCVNRYIAKPWKGLELQDAIERALADYHMILENRRLTDELDHANRRLRAENAYLRAATEAELVGSSAAMEKVRSAISRVAPKPTTVLLLGESGTGKELAAKAIHTESERREHLFVAVNCAALAEGVLESELFGHKRGAFTNAIGDKKGLFDVADGGTLFLDEIAETTTGLQAKLLRALQEGKIRAVGDTRDHPVDVRVIAATNRVLDDEVREKRFRDDLFHRLNVFPIVMPPLRERGGDVGTLARHFARLHAARMGMPEPALGEDALAALSVYDFPGNVRELSNIIERALILTEPGEPISRAHLPSPLQEATSEDGAGGLSGAVDDFERRQIAECLAECAGNKTHAAKRLRITYQGLQKKMRRLGMLDPGEER